MKLKIETDDKHNMAQLQHLGNPKLTMMASSTYSAFSYIKTALFIFDDFLEKKNVNKESFKRLTNSLENAKQMIDEAENHYRKLKKEYNG